MASFYLLCQNLSSTTLTVVFDAIQEAEAARVVETQACCVIQAMARMVSQKQKFAQVRRACIHIQRMYRGYRGRIAALNQKVAREGKRWHRFFTHFAILIQKSFRGYFSRKWRYDYYRQKVYLKEVVARSDGVRASMEEHYQRSSEEEAMRQQTQLTQSFDRITRNLHHLVSTNVIPGVFRDPRTGVARQTVFETDIEKTLRELKVSPQKRLSGGAAATLPTPATMAGALSLQASCRYDAAKEALLMEKKLNKIMCLENRGQWFESATTNTAAAMARLSPRNRPLGGIMLPELKPIPNANANANANANGESAKVKPKQSSSPFAVGSSTQPATLLDKKQKQKQKQKPLGNGNKPKTVEMLATGASSVPAAVTAAGK